MTSLDTLKESVDALGYTFHEFKALNDQRLENLERKDNVDLLLLQKMDRLNEELTQAQEKVLHMQIASKRPMRGTTGLPGHGPGEEDAKLAHAFLDYIRKENIQGLESFDKISQQ